MKGNRNIAVTSYIGPDLDGISSMYAYSEFLNKTGKKANYYICGEPKKEVEIVCDMFGIKLNEYENINLNDRDIIILDTNDINSLSLNINILNVVEIIDHHIESESIRDFKNAKIHIEIIGAVATLIAEKFYKQSVPISRESAILLYYGIISNSINLKAPITSVKDIEMANWLKEQCKEDITDEKIKEIFKKKSNIEGSLREEMEADIKIVMKEKSFTIAQLELVNVKDFLQNNIEKIKEVLNIIKKEKELNYIFLNCIDIFEGYNTIVTVDKDTEKLLEEILNIEVKNGIGKTENIIMRKQMISLIKEKMK